MSMVMDKYGHIEAGLHVHRGVLHLRTYLTRLVVRMQRSSHDAYSEEQKG